MLKKIMPRQVRLNYLGCFQHVMGRKINDLKIFCKETDKQNFLSRLKEIKKSSMSIQEAKIDYLGAFH